MRQHQLLVANSCQHYGSGAVRRGNRPDRAAARRKIVGESARKRYRP